MEGEMSKLCPIDVQAELTRKVMLQASATAARPATQQVDRVTVHQLGNVTLHAISPRHSGVGVDFSRIDDFMSSGAQLGSLRVKRWKIEVLNSGHRTGDVYAGH
jgi:hypothetical protein